MFFVVCVCLVLVGQVVSEEKSFEKLLTMRDGEGRRTHSNGNSSHGLSVGELIKGTKIQTEIKRIFTKYKK